MVFPTSEPLLAGKPDMNKPFRIPKNPIHDLNLTGSNAIAKHKKKNKKWKVLSNNPVPIINNINGKPNNAAIISAAPPHFNSNPMARPMMMMMMPPRMSWMGHHSVGMNNGSVQNSIGPLNGGNNGHSNALEMPIPRSNIDNMMLSLTPSASSSSSSRKKSVKRRKIASRNSNNKRAYYYPNMSSSFHAPLAPRNTTSFIMRAKQQGGIASAVTPSPATLVQTPLLSPGFREKGSLEEMNKELGVDGYGSMNGLIRLRSSYEDRAAAAHSETESDVEQGDNMTAIAVDGKGRSNGRDGEDPTVHSVEQRIDEGLSRFEMIYPSSSSTAPIQDAGGMMMMRMMPRRDSSGSDNNIQNCVNGQERLIARLEEENLTLKERLFLVEQERNELRRRVREMEGLTHADDEVLLGEEHLEESCGDVSTPCHQ